jgi:hypothetical protein
MKTQNNHTGQCKCGCLTFVLKGAPLFTHACHCLDCQRRTGSAFAMTTFALSDELTIQGDLASRAISPRSTQYRCANCDTIIYVASTAFPSSVTMKSGTFDNPVAVEPMAHIWVKRKQPWVTLTVGVPQFEEQYDRDTTWPAETLARFRSAGAPNSA